VGAVILWFGWYGFNPGSTLSALDFDGIGRVAANTTLAACAGGMVGVLFVYPRSKKWDIGMCCNAFLGGLVAVTAPCYWVSPFGAVVIGAIAGIVVPLGVDLLEHWRVDDPIGAWPVHGLTGIWGTLSVGLFATGAYGIPTPDGVDTTGVVRGLFYGGGFSQLKAQFIGSAVVVVIVSAVALTLMYAIRSVKLLRLSHNGELEGMDIYEHGTPAYHMEFGQGMTYTTLTGVGPTKAPTPPDVPAPPKIGAET
jgi:Amt family ammonium transporter